MQHNYFTIVWKSLSTYQKDKIIEILSSGKGLYPFEKDIFTNSLGISPEKNLFDKDEFYSKLKRKQVLDDDYEKSKYLCINLKMRNLNDIYN